VGGVASWADVSGGQAEAEDVHLESSLRKGSQAQDGVLPGLSRSSSSSAPPVGPRSRSDGLQAGEETCRAEGRRAGRVAGPSQGISQPASGELLVCVWAGSACNRSRV